ncbi:MAG TPA: choice-of-anchor Q domain-containing protein, partial [Candidatus Saccharimonadales bacterium]|nr:choice-of-anchor Q domain-containing protein [Candidatus Saccharimonadales bacterium]
WPTNLTFRNNFFGSDQNPTFSSGIPDCTGYVWAYNTHHDTPGDSCIANGTWIGNLAPRPGYYTCEGTHTKNVWQDSINYTCGSDKVIVGTRFASDSLGLGGSDGFHLTASSPAIDAAESGGYCTSTLGAKDIDGNSRPQGAACDAGADEYTPSANVWISATGSDTTCVRGDSTKPCASFNKACSIAQGGDIVQVADGTYPSQDLSTCTGKTSTVTFKPVSGHECPYSAATPWSSLPAQNSDTSCDVTLGDLTLYNQSYPSMTTPTDIVNSSLKNLDFEGMYATTVTVGFAHNITLDHMAATDFYVSASDTVTIQNSDFGNVYNGDCSTVSNRGNTPTPYPDSSNVTIKGNIFHDSMRLTSAQSHPDGLFIQGLNGGVIDGNVFYRDAVLPLYLNSVAGGSIQNISITNNLIHDVVDMTDTGSSTLSQPQGNFSPQTISLGDNNISNITVAFNSVSGWIRRQDNTQSGGNGTGTTTNLQVYGNIAQGYVYGNSYGCSINTAFDYNYWYGGSGSKCGIHDSLGSGSSPFTVADTWTASGSYYTVAPGNYSLKTATVPIDFVPTSFCTANAGICPTADFSSLARPYGAAYDAGAEELGATGTPTTPGDLNSDGHVNITDLSIILTNWATSNPTCDLNANGTVDIFDLSILLSHFGI